MEITQDKKTAILIGATGFVGSHCLQLLLSHQAYQKIIVLTRRSLELDHPKLEEHVIDFDDLAAYQALLAGHDFFSCLGTTMAKAGNKEAFFKVDFKYVYTAARLAAENKVNQYLLVSSVGADQESTFYYSRVKGELEEAIKDLPFWSIHIFQPSILLGERNENRWGEKWAGRIGKWIDSATGGLLTKYRPVEAEVVAESMVNAAQGLREGLHIYPSHLLQALAEADNNKPNIIK